MPYITPARRKVIDRYGELPQSAGELNYLITTTLTDYLDTCGLSYKTINDIMGALEGAKAEFYRRVAAPYEDTKIVENGDVYPMS